MERIDWGTHVCEYYDPKEFASRIRNEGPYVKGEDIKIIDFFNEYAIRYPKGKKPRFYKRRVKGSRSWRDLVNEVGIRNLVQL
ncbi:MAG: hypothetical protein ACE5J7_02995 [Candidatus Aenigmatarchaeota archaeon]